MKRILERLTAAAPQIIAAAAKNYRSLAALCIIAIAACVIAFLYFRSESQNIGDDAVVMGNVPSTTKVGNGSVVIGPTDAHGNTIINQPMAVGHNAQAGPNSIAIGAGAGAGATHGNGSTPQGKPACPLDPRPLQHAGGDHG